MSVLQLINMLTWWQWLILAAVPPAIIALYFLKLKRRPLEVPSTYLWHRSIEDLHVNTIWQRLRRNLLLFLQLLLIFLAMLALLRPGWRGEKVSGDRFIFLIDNSASMQATDSEPSRLEEAKRRAAELIDQMTSRDVGMIVSFADSPRIEQMFTHNRRQLRLALDSIQPTQRPTSLAEALKVTSPLANPGRTGEDPTDYQVADPLPATLYIFSDGKFPDASSFRLGNLDPVYIPIGSAAAANVGIVTFSIRRSETGPMALQAFARLENFGPEDATVSVELRLDGDLIDADRIEVAAEKPTHVVFPLGAVESGVLELRATEDDDLRCDDVAWTVVNPPQRSRVLIVTPGSRALDSAFGTKTVSELADVTIRSPDFLGQTEYQQQAAVGAYDLVIYDRCQPKEMPQANTLFIRTLPPAEADEEADENDPEGGEDQERKGKRDRGWKAEAKVKYPVIIDIDAAHPLMHWIQMDRVFIDEATPLKVPPGGTILVDSVAGPLLAVAPRESFEDAVMGFALVYQTLGDAGASETLIGTNWWFKPSFTVFVLNLLDYLGGGRAALEAAALKPGQPLSLDGPIPGESLEVRTPTGKTIPLREAGSGKLSFTGTSELGVYQVRSAGKTLQHFAVNLFHGPESDIRPSREIKIGRGTPIEGQSSDGQITRRELWKWLLLAGLIVLLVEWYIYNRRVYL